MQAILPAELKRVVVCHSFGKRLFVASARHRCLPLALVIGLHAAAHAVFVDLATLRRLLARAAAVLLFRGSPGGAAPCLPVHVSEFAEPPMLIDQARAALH